MYNVHCFCFAFFRFESAEPGSVYSKTTSDAEKKRSCLVKDVANFPSLSDMLPVKASIGLSQDLKEYLWKEIRHFLDEDKANLLAPRPAWVEDKD